MENKKLVPPNINTILSIYLSTLFLITEFEGLNSSFMRILYFNVKNSNCRIVLESKLVHI